MARIVKGDCAGILYRNVARHVTVRNGKVTGVTRCFVRLKRLTITGRVVHTDIRRKSIIKSVKL